MPGNVRKKNGAAYRRAVAEVRARHEGCWICEAFGRDPAIDYSLPPSDPGAFQVDHLVPVSKGGSLYDPANLAATHRRCNQWRKAKSVAEVMRIARGIDAEPAPRWSTDW
ncbi:MAG: HNH endonuclease signature motif containing protein [Coriobacteriales bacterium]|nr:HNH endonuclease signature motif containing protein [Coriobacteriales bacterium]